MYVLFMHDTEFSLMIIIIGMFIVQANKLLSTNEIRWKYNLEYDS